MATTDIRKKLRSVTVGAKKQFKSEKIEWQGETFEVRQPSVAQRAEIMKNAQTINADDQQISVDYAKMQVWSVICCTYVPGEDGPIFTAGDYENLAAMPAGGFVDKFASLATRLMNADVEEISKNLEEIQSVSASSE